MMNNLRIRRVVLFLVCVLSSSSTVGSGRTLIGAMIAGLAITFHISVISTVDTAEAECGIYYAPSTVPGAGMGMFAGKAMDADEFITTGDIVIPIFDLESHNIDIDIELLALQQYYWLTYEYSGIPEESCDSFAFAPGVGAAVNCFFPLVNTQGWDRGVKMSSAGLHRSKDPGAGAITLFHDRRAYALRDIKAGEELFADYGENYFVHNEEEYGLIPLYSSYPRADALIQKYVSARDKLCATQLGCSGLHSDWYTLVTKLSSVWPSRVLNALPEKPSIVDEIAEIGTSFVHQNRSTRSLEWLRKHGQCMDNLVAGGSKLPQAGRGAFARRFIPKGGLVGPAPLVHVDRSVLLMYPGDVIEGEFVANITSQPIHQQLLINYCFGHRDVSFVLCPYGMATSLINHSREPNARVVWSSKTMRQPDWLNTPVSEWILNDYVGLSFDFIATKDIYPGEEVCIDYGDDWQKAWDHHLATWKPPAGAQDYHPAYELNEAYESIIYTVFERYYNVSTLEILCRDQFIVWFGVTDDEEADDDTDDHNCRVLRRYTKSGEVVYMVEIYDRVDPVDGELCYDTVYALVWDLPRDAIYFKDRQYSRDAHQVWSFRHPIGIPDDILPEKWKRRGSASF